MSLMIRVAVILLLLITCTPHIHAQEPDLAKIADSIKSEGKALFYSEWASWYGNDIFRSKCKSKAGRAGGYFSYNSGKGLKNIFFTKGDDPVVLATTSFGYDFNPNHYKLDTIERPLTPFEKELCNLRQTARKRVYADTTVKFFKSTSFNFVPMIRKGKKQVYILTGSSVDGVITFGNDYLLNFNDAGSIVSLTKIHRDLIPIKYEKVGTDTAAREGSGYHNHLAATGDYITATDVCTLMLYEKLTDWHQYVVLSKNYISIWDCQKNLLGIITKEAWRKIEADRKKVKKN